MCALLLAAPGALAQDVQIDPDSPAGTEYQIPFEDARGDDGAGSPSGSAGSSTGSSGSTPGSDSSDGGSGGTPAPSGDDAGGSTGATGGPTTTLPIAVPQSSAEQDAGGMSPGLLILLATLGVLALGGLAGWLARWRRGGTPGDLMSDTR